MSAKHSDISGDIAKRSGDRLVSHRLLVDFCREPAFTCRHGVLLYANTAFMDLAGYRGDEFTDLGLATLFPKGVDNAQLFTATENGSLLAGRAAVFQASLLHRDSTTRIPVSMRALVLPGDDSACFVASLHPLADHARLEPGSGDSALKYRAMFENSVIGMYRSTPEGCLLDGNQALAELLGFDTVATLLRELQHIRNIYADPRDRDALVGEIESLGSMHQREIRWRRRDGRVLWVLENSRVIYGPDGKAQFYEGTAQEITARRNAQERLQNSEKRYRALVETSHVGVFLSVAGRCIYANSALAKLLGWTEEEMIGQPYHAFYAPECHTDADARHASREAGGADVTLVEVTLLHKDGKTRINVTLYISTFEEDGALYTAGTVLDVTERKRAEAQLIYNATRDTLTGLPNRGFLTDRLADVLARAQGDGRYDFAVMFLDVDEFKFVNDSFGHAQGDRMLIEITRRLQTAIRSNDIIARHGGDEFTILLENMASPQDALAVAERIESALRAPVVLDSGETWVHASIGITFGRPEYHTAEQMLRDADIAMYRAKSSGKTCHVVFDTGMHEAVRRRLSSETDIRLALERNQFRAHYQPIYELRKERLVGFEALLRWEHPTRGLLAPVEFLDVAEESSLILPIGWWMLQHAAMQLGSWRKHNPWARDLTMSVNVSNRQFASPFLIDQVKAVLAASELPPPALCLEITESVFIRDSARALATLNELKALGVGLHLDDFGTGFSSLGYLSTYPVDVLKVDRLFIMGMKTDTRRQNVLRTIMQLARELGIQAIAEGIETPEQARMLVQLGFRYGQGYLLGKAMAAHDVEQRLGLQEPASRWQQTWLRFLAGRSLAGGAGEAAGRDFAGGG